MCVCSTSAKSPTSRMTNSQEVEGAVKAGVAEREVGRRDRGHEAIVERVRDPEPGVHTVPAGPQRELVRAQLTGVEDAQNLHPGVMRLEQRPVLVERVLPHVPWVV